MSPALLVLHEMGDAAAGAPWRGAVLDAGWQGDVIAPDLPGHGGAAPLADGNYELATPAWFAIRYLDQLHAPVVLGIGTSGWSAQVIALAGRARAVVLVDGWGGPWLSPADVIAAQASWLRALAGDPDAVGTGAMADGLDPRLRHGVMGMSDEAAAHESAAALADAGIPVLAVETPDAPLAAADTDAVMRRFGGAVTRTRAGSRRAADVASAVVSWAAGAGLA